MHTCKARYLNWRPICKVSSVYQIYQLSETDTGTQVGGVIVTPRRVANSELESDSEVDRGHNECTDVS